MAKATKSKPLPKNKITRGDIITAAKKNKRRA